VRVLFVGDDWAEDHHDVEILDSDGKRLGRARLPEGMAEMQEVDAEIRGARVRKAGCEVHHVS
jgi:glutamine cyclotransferase